MEKNYSAEFIRNTVIAGAPNAGKTTLAEAMLFVSGKIPHMGSIERGNTVMDFDEEEIKRKMSLKSSLAHIEYHDIKINFLDVPGITDLSAELRSALSAVESVIFVISSSSGISIDCEKNWNILENYEIPKIILVNKMDAENADFFKLLGDLETKFKKHFIPFMLPIGTGKDFKGVFDIIHLKPYFIDKNNKSEDIPDSIKDILSKYREKLFESAAESDDKLIEKYLNGDELSPQEIETGIKNSVKNKKFIPVLCASATNNAGITLLLDTITAYLPSPLYYEEFEGKNPLNPEEKIKRKQKTDEPFSGFIFKTRVDPFAGKLSFCRIKSGVLSLGADVYNVNKSKKEKAGHLYSVVGKNTKENQQVSAGDIIVFAKQDSFETGDTIATADKQILYENIKFPSPSYFVAVHSSDRKSGDKIAEAFHQVNQEDPTFTYGYNDITKELTVSCAGEIQSRIVFESIKERYKINFETRTPRVAYKETITAKAEGHYKHKKQSGGHGQYGEVYLRIEPLKRNEGFIFDEEIFGGAIPKNYIPAIEKGAVEACLTGAIAGYPVVDLKVVVYDGTYHDVDSSDMSFKIAGLFATKLAIEAAKPALLEPITKVKIFVDESDIGSIMNDLNTRRGRVLGIEKFSDTISFVNVYVPYAEMLTYSAALNSITKGKGRFEMEFSHYDFLPFNEYDKAKKQAEEMKKEEEAKKNQ